jgi:DNA-binding PucR family transcriptional regulator
MKHAATSPLLARHLVCPELTVLMAYDQKNRTPFFETLRQYLLMERDIPKTSEALIIHRTTLLYRLKKIQSLVHLNLEDPWTRLQLMLSLWILEKEEITDLSL